MPLSRFHPIIAEWFRARFGSPTDVQARSWPAIASGENVLIAAPTGSGKTLAAFLSCLDALFKQARRALGAVVRATRRARAHQTGPHWPVGHATTHRDDRALSKPAVWLSDYRHRPSPRDGLGGGSAQGRAGGGGNKRDLERHLR